MKRPNPWRAIRSLINYAAVALATAAACDLYHHFADDPPDTWTPPVLVHEQGRCGELDLLDPAAPAGPSNLSRAADGGNSAAPAAPRAEELEDT